MTLALASDSTTDRLPGDLTYRVLDAADIPAVNRLLFEEYGPAYPYPLKALNSDGVYVVAEFLGEVIAFARAAPYSDYPQVYEFGGLIVRPDFRMHHVAARLTDIRIERVLSLGGRLAMSENVCYRADCRSQWNLVKRGFVLCGIQPFKYPSLHTDLLGDQPETVLLAAKVLRTGEDSGFGRRRTFLPNGLNDLLRLFLPRRVYERGWSESVPGEMPDHAEHSSYHVNGSSGSTFVDVPINWPEAEGVVLAYIHAGYRFSAILPGFGLTATGHTFDLVRLYRPPDIPLTFDLVHVADPLRKLHAFMAREYQPGT